MGIETALILGFAGLSAVSSISQSRNEAEAVVDQANIDADNKAKQTRLLAARQQSSFLSSGLTLEGTPLGVINNTFDTGIADIEQITSNANSQAKNIISAGRTEALTTLASAAGGVSFGGGNLFSGTSIKTNAMSLLPESTLLGMNGTSNTFDAYSALEIKDQRGFL